MPDAPDVDRIAQHLVEAQATAAMLTTFNEVDMSAVMELRNRRKDSFREKYGVGLGINSFFIKATVGALKQFPMLNAEIDGDYIINKNNITAFHFSDDRHCFYFICFFALLVTDHHFRFKIT